MMDMSIPYEATGRTSQKARTRAALVDATRALLSAGTTPTVEEAASAAGISRTTAYRYFPNQRAILVASFPEVAAESLLPEPAPSSVEQRLDAVVSRIARQAIEHEPELRAQLRLSLEPDGDAPRDLPFRTGRAIGWIEDALEPLREELAPAELRRLVYAIRCAVGIEPLVWLTDIAGLSREEAAEVMRWAASALLRSAVAEVTEEATPESARDRP